MLNSKAWRMLAVVAALFVLVGVLIVVVRRKSESPPAIGPEPEELARIRLLQTENGYFLLQQAIEQLPRRPAGKNIGHAKGPVAELLHVSLEEDAPELVAVVEAMRPAVKLTRAAVRMNYLLMPIEWSALSSNPLGYGRYDSRVETILAGLFLVAIRDAKSGANTQESVQCLLDYYRLYWRCIDGLLWGASDWYIYHKASLVIGCPPQFQDQLLPALLEFRARWEPPKYWLDTSLRLFEAVHPAIIRRTQPRWQVISLSIRAALARPLLARNLDTLREVSGYVMWEYRNWEKHNRRLAGAANLPGFDVWIRQICRTSSTYILELDGLCTVVALEKYKRDHGNYAPALEDVVPAYLPKAPIDPYSGRPLIYRREADDYRLYSVGGNGQDDGGHPFAEEWSQDILVHPDPALDRSR
ncbi:MAG TPA: hypothetical protein VMZ06_10035 [Candidatus Bathyarchaeia archaeon]|nr:hypothetical protein [Candidatus Bathyarchaeia archaeon]